MSEIKLRAKDVNGNDVEFDVAESLDPVDQSGLVQVYLGGSSGLWTFIDPATIQLADDPQSSDALIKASGKEMSAVRSHELAALREQVKVLREALETIRLILSENKIATGICTCGSPIRGHGAWSYHVPRDSGHEITDCVISMINTALNMGAK